MNPSRRSSRRRARQPRISQPVELRPEPLEPRQLLATTATLSTEPPPVRLPVTFRGDAAGPITWQSVPTGQLPWLDATGDVRVAGLPATFHAFCVDGVQNVSWGGTYTFPEFTSAVNAGPVGGASAAMGVDRANLLTQLLNQFGPADPAAGFASVTEIMPVLFALRASRRRHDANFLRSTPRPMSYLRC